MEEEAIIEERKKKFLGFLKQKKTWVFGILILAVILGVYIRSMPMHDHGGQPGLWDITTNDWTLGPDLDPWLFTRYAKIIVEQGSLPEVDVMRNVPLGSDPLMETRLLPYMIAWNYNILNLFGEYSVEFAAAFLPVIMFALTIIAFFFFVREIFIRKSKKSKIRASIIALISTFFMIVIPIFLSRTVAGIPEKESAGFFFMFLSFYLFLKAWKSERLKKAIIFGALAGFSTALMGLISGLVIYIFVAIAIACFIGFILNKIHKKEFIIYSLLLIISWGLMTALSKRYSLSVLISSTSTGIAFLVFFIMLVHFILWNTKLKEINLLKRIKLPKNIISLIIATVLGIVLVSILFGPSFILDILRDINQTLFRPVTGRWNITVAENRQPFFTEWGASFGPFIKNIPIMFWMFFVGSVILFKKMLSGIKRKDSWVLTGLYVLFFFGLVFSRYSSSSIFNGENFISKLFYFGSVFLLVGFLIYYYVKYHKQGNRGFERIRFEYLLLFSLFALCLFTARSAVRLIMVLGPIAPIFVGFLIVVSIESFRRTNKGTKKIVVGILVILILLLSLFSFWNYYNSVKFQAYNFVPSHYNQQWQKAMAWVRDNTAEDAVFAHWWDYGYWVQSIGDRATVLDGGNLITFWNYYMGRLVLTGDNQEDALEFLYNHDADYLLIDPTDIGKYGAFSSIGSDENYDRYSFIPTLVFDGAQTRETAKGQMRVYQGGYGTDEDILYDLNGSQIFLPGGATAIAGIILETIEEGDSISFSQPEIVLIYNNQQIRVPLRYVYFNGQFKDFGGGLEGTANVVQQVFADGRIDNLGTVMYISPRVMRGFLAQKYLLNDPFDKFPNFKLVYSEHNFVVESLRSQGLDVEDFVWFNGVQGPIKIWKIQYTGSEKERPEYLDTDPSKYLSWEL